MQLRTMIGVGPVGVGSSSIRPRKAMVPESAMFIGVVWTLEKTRTKLVGPTIVVCACVIGAHRRRHLGRRLAHARMKQQHLGDLCGLALMGRPNGRARKSTAPSARSEWNIDS